jgi:iron complex transport system ATP-binding protein
MTAVIETQQLSVRIGPKTLLDRVSLSIAQGESLALVGPNGAGKSTLLRTLSGEIIPSAGIVDLRGQPPRSYRPYRLALHRAVLSQHVAVAFPFSVAEIVHMGAGSARGPKVDALVEAALAEVDMADMRERIIGTLSGGEQQRTHLARVLVQLACGEVEHGPGILMLDEPTASLDLCHQLDLLAIIKRRHDQGTTVITVMHDLNLAVLFARRVVALAHGAIARDGASNETISDDMLREVFGVAGAVNRVPQGAPFVLPHQASKAAP